MKRLIQFLALACAVPLAVLGATSDQPPRANTDVATAVKSDNATDSELIAAGKGVTVTRAQIEQLVTNLKANAAAQNQVILPERLNELKRQLLDGLIARQLLLGKATEEDKVKAKVEFLKALHQLKTNAHLTDEQFEKKLAPQLLIANQTRDQWEKQRIEDATIPIVLEREL